MTAVSAPICWSDVMDSGPVSAPISRRRCSADQLQALGYPISGADDELRAGHRRYNFGWYRVADAATLKQMCVDDHGREYEFGVPPPLVHKGLVAQMHADAETLLPPQYLDCLQHIDQPFFTPVYDFCSPSLVFGRVALVGDAASTPRPHIGFGVSKAGAEAQASRPMTIAGSRNCCRALKASWIGSQCLISWTRDLLDGITRHLECRCQPNA